MLELQLMKARHQHSIYHLQFAPMFQKSSFFFWRIDTPVSKQLVLANRHPGVQVMWVIALIKSVKDLHPKMASKDGRACKLQRRLKTGGWVKGKFSHGEITWHIFLESWLRVFVLVNICDVVSKLNSVEIAICYLPRFLPQETGAAPDVPAATTRYSCRALPSGGAETTGG